MPTETNPTPPRAPRVYQITVEGKVDATWAEWLGGLGLDARTEADGQAVTTLRGTLADQAALRGVLNRLWDLNLALRSVEQVTPASQTDTAKEAVR